MTKKTTFIIIGLLSFVLAFISGGEAFYNAGIFVFIVLLINYNLIKNNIKKIDSNFVINKESHVVSEEIKFKYILVNKSIIPIQKSQIELLISKEFGVMTSNLERMSFKANQIIELKRSFVCEKRGYFEIGKLHVKVSDVFGFFEKEKILDKAISIKVYPKIYPVSNHKSNLSGFLGDKKSKKSTIDDFTNLKSIREYRIGDNPKNINFKLSAKSDKLYIKEYYDLNYLDLIVIVDGSLDPLNDYGKEEKCISLSLSITKFIIESKGHVQFMISNKSSLNEKIKSVDSYVALIEKTISTSFDGEKKLGHFLGNIAMKTGKSSDYIIVTSHVDEELAARIISMNSNSSSVSLYIVDYDMKSRDNDLLNVLSVNGVDFNLIYNLDEL